MNITLMYFNACKHLFATALLRSYAKVLSNINISSRHKHFILQLMSALENIYYQFYVENSFLFSLKDNKQKNGIKLICFNAKMNTIHCVNLITNIILHELNH